MSNDLISREDLKKALRSECRKCKNIYMFECLTHLLNITDNAPTVERPTGEWEKVTEAHEDIGYDRGFRDGYAQAVEERTCEWVNDEEGRNHEQRY